MKFEAKYIILLFITIGWMTIGQAQQKIGYVNSQEILSTMPEVEEARASLKTYGEQLTKRAQQMYTNLEQKYNVLREQQADGVLSPKQLDEEANKLKEEETKLAEFQQSSQMQIAQKEEELLSPILQRVQDVIDAVAKAEGYTYVFDASQGLILYADESVNLGPTIKAKLGL